MAWSAKAYKNQADLGAYSTNSSDGYAPMQLMQSGSETPIAHMTLLWAALVVKAVPAGASRSAVHVHVGGSGV
jgi:hypothetical protein